MMDNLSSSTPPLLPSPGDTMDFDFWAALQRNLFTRNVQNVQRQLALRYKPVYEDPAEANLGEKGVRRYMSLPAH